MTSLRSSSSTSRGPVAASEDAVELRVTVNHRPKQPFRKPHLLSEAGDPRV